MDYFESSDDEYYDKYNDDDICDNDRKLPAAAAPSSNCVQPAYNHLSILLDDDDGNYNEILPSWANKPSPCITSNNATSSATVCNHHQEQQHQPEIVDLRQDSDNEDNDDDDDVMVSYNTSASTAAAGFTASARTTALTTAPWAHSQAYEEDVATSGSTSYSFFTSINAAAKKKRRTSSKTVATTKPSGVAVIKSSSAEIVDLDGNDHDSKSKQLDAATQYRRALGPLRMEFCQSLNHHVFANGKPKSGYGNRKLHYHQHHPMQSISALSQEYPTTSFHSFMMAQPPSRSPTTTNNNSSSGGGGSSSNNNNDSNTSMRKLKQLYKELLEYQLNLPIELNSSIFVRVMESRLDLVRALITGPADTPYANGCFLFDIWLYDYPYSAPQVRFLTTAGGSVRFNPNLYNCGKVCLSLLGTWSGPGWQSNQSTLLQVLVSIQGLILVEEPYYNEPGYDKRQPHHQRNSTQYTLKIRAFTLQHAMIDMLKPIALKEQSPPQAPPTAAAPPPQTTITATTSNVKSLSWQQRQTNTAAPITNIQLYPEFHKVILQHFVHRSDAIQRQLHHWLAEDPSLKNRVEQMCQLLQRAEQEHQLERSRLETEATAIATATTNPPSIPSSSSQQRSELPPPSYAPPDVSAVITLDEDPTISDTTIVDTEVAEVLAAGAASTAVGGVSTSKDYDDDIIVID